MVYSLENIRFLRQELERLTEQSRQLRESLAELKRRAGLDPDAPFPTSAGSEPSAAPAPEAESLFSGRFSFNKEG